MVSAPSLRKQMQLLEPRPSLGGWGQGNIIIPRGEGKPGPLILEPWQLFICDLFLQPGVTDITLMVGSQIGKSLLITMMLFFAAVFDVSCMLVVPSGPLRTRWVRQKLNRLSRSCPAFRAVVSWTPSGGIHEEGIYLLDGSMIPVAVGGGTGQLQQFTAELVLVDEYDKFEVDPEGALRARGNTLENYQMVRNGTPVAADESFIGWQYYENSNMCRPWVRCCLCDEETPLSFNAEHPGAVWCQSCGAAWDWEHQREMPAYWKPERPEITDHWGFQASTLISAMVPWRRVLANFRHLKVFDFTTQFLAEPFAQDVEKPPELEQAELMFGQHEWEGTPARMLVVDVQRRDGGTLSVAAIDVYGTEAEPALDYRWQTELYKLGTDWSELWMRFRREMYEVERPDLLVVDVGDHEGSPTEAILEQLFAYGLSSGQVVRVKGDGNRHSRFWPGDPAVKNGWTKEDVVHRGKLLSLNVNTTKSRLMYMMHDGRVKLTGDRTAYPQDILAQLTSEKLVYLVKGLETQKRWVEVKSGIHNEAWDQGVYALSGLSYLGPNWVSMAGARVNMERVRAVARMGGQPPEPRDHDPAPSRKTEPEELPRGERARRFVSGGRQT